jgi:hypothetical protein
MPREMTKKLVNILNRGLELINSVYYSVSARWVFYRLLQESFYSKKSDYASFIILTSKARKRFMDGWHPNILADDTRARITRTGGEKNVQACIDGLVSELTYSVNFSVDHFYQQEKYAEIWFEAKAMAGQFRHYTSGIDLVPFGGHPSIPYKYGIAQHLSGVSHRYDKDIVVLYFGDYDSAGDTIINSALWDIQQWCDVPFELVRCGLNQEQAIQFNIPENFEKPGEYQWEALPDEAAAQIIRNCVSHHVDQELIDEINDEAQKQEDIWTAKVEKALEVLGIG